MNTELLKLLRCPQSRSELVLEGDSLVSRDAASRMQYPIKAGIPVLVPAEGISLPQEEWERIMRAHAIPPCSAS